MNAKPHTKTHAKPHPQAPAPAEARCASCVHFSRPGNDALIEGTAFGRCQRQPAGHYVSPWASCRLQPVAWSARHA